MGEQCCSSRLGEKPALLLLHSMILQEEVDKLGTKSHVSSSTAKFSEEINLEEVNKGILN